ncbi:hypothetical protein HZS_7960, partial [Henneguya salminicola]
CESSTPTAVLKQENSCTTPKKAAAKWCSFLKSRFHDESECRKNVPCRKDHQKKPDHHTKHHSRSNELAHIIHEPNTEITEISLNGTINGQSIQTLIDTGARSNYVSKSLALSIGLEIAEIPEKRKVELGDGNSTSVIGNSNAVIKIVDQTLPLDQKHQLTWLDNPDAALSEKAMSVDIRSKKVVVLERIASEERTKVSNKPIPDCEMKITLTEKKTISCRPYPIPL